MSQAVSFSEPVAYAIASRWKDKRWSKHIRDDNAQLKLIRARCQQYVYPDYQELVGLPKPKHYTADGELTLERKAQLLLIGVFEWRGLLIAKYDRAFTKDRRYWAVVDDPTYDPTQELKLYCESEGTSWEKDEKGWYVERRSGGKYRTDFEWEDNYFDPFYSYKSSALIEKLYNDQLGNSQVLWPCVDKNPYDCSPNNVVIVRTRKKTAAFKKAITLDDPMAYNLLKVLQDHPKGMTRTEILNAFQRNIKGPTIGRALKLLAREGLAYSKQERGRGRPADRWIASFYVSVQPSSLVGFCV